MNGIVANSSLDFTTTAEFTELLATLQAGRLAVAVSGVSGAARALLAVNLHQRLARPLLLITRNNRELEALEEDLRFFYALCHPQIPIEKQRQRVRSFPAIEIDPYQGLSPHPEIEQQRVLALDSLARGECEIVLIAARALIERTPTPKQLLNLAIQAKIDEECPPDLLVEMLLANGYLRAEPVNEVGTFSLRGGILDVFPPNFSEPLRLEFFGDTVESIRTFDAESQRSISNLASCRLLPLRVQTTSIDDWRRFAQAAREYWTAPQFQRDLNQKMLTAQSATNTEGWQYLLPLINPLESSVFDYLRNPLLLIDEPSEITTELETALMQLAKQYQQVINSGLLALPPEKLFMTAEGLTQRIPHRQRVELRALGLLAAKTDDQFTLENTDPSQATKLFLFPVEACPTEFRLSTTSVRRYHGRIPDLVHDLRQHHQRSGQTIIVTHTIGMAERITEILRDYALQPETRSELTPTSGLTASSSEAIIMIGRLSAGFEIPAKQLQIFVEGDLFDETTVTMRAPATRKRKNLTSFLSDFRDLKPGDYVVHVDHGIGQFQGLQQIAVDPSKVREFMFLTYADGAKLYVPVERLDLVQKYSSAETANRPSLDRLGGIGWQKTKARVKKVMRDMAEELLKLYAERKLVKRQPFTPDSPWQHEFEDAFEYALTPDQETATVDIKADLHGDTPMDRLLCGDVGFGKTEVAMRAAFKAIVDGKQVAVLTPTTVLAYQHYKTFQQRFNSFPVTVEMLSRFRTPKQQKETVQKLATGKVDIVIGTHRLLSKDVQFKNLGLVIIDEEQRFGVGHKERLKQLRRRVDVLTLSATPIPRTLNMSLAGLRDMSVIETPPSDRLAIQTHIVPFNAAIIKTAIELELQRQGQVFFVHNRVESIYTIAGMIQELLPQARIGVGHGQLHEQELEDVMMRFVRHETDVLVATTIIENGIDIPLANTIIIDRADHYGLSQLYQLRGRVGRSSRRAYAYLLVPHEDTLSPIARRRLAAIREFSDLGAGFRIAALDLELRGAGNLLGGEQSGQIDAIGFDLYCQMLERTVQELKGAPIDDELTTSINLSVDVRIPEDFIQDMGQRLRTYKRISSAASEAELSEIAAELEDRYGRCPDAVRNLFQYAQLKSFATKCGVLSIDRDGRQLTVKFSERAKINADKLINFVAGNKEVSFSPSGVLKLKLPENILETSDATALFQTTENLLRGFAKLA